MASPNSAIDICNLALDHLQQEPIMSIAPAETTPEVICARWYDADRSDLLRQHPWNFAIKRAQLAPSATPPIFGYSKAFNVPSDFLRLLPLNENTGKGFLLDDISASYQFEQKQILTNSSSNVLNLRYIFDLVDVPKFDSSFVELLALKMAANMARAFSGSIGLRSSLQADYINKFSNVASIDGQERPPTRIQNSKFLAARRRGSKIHNSYVVF